MGRYRLYPDKSNTVIEGENTNTGYNPVMELWYGNEGRTRHFLHFDFDTYYALYQLNYVPHITAATSTLHLENCYPILEDSEYYESDSTQASSFDLEVKVVQQPWDGGRGHDFFGKDKEDGYCNWYSATTSTHWATPGGDFMFTVFSGHVDVGYENFSGEVTDVIELWNAFTGQNYGFAVKYSDTLEAMTTSNRNISKYYTDNARTKYKMPYIEFEWDDQVKDQRNEVGHDLTKRLYFYLRRDEVFTSANDISGVTITYAHPSYSDDFFPPSAITQQYPGVYYIEYLAPSHIVGALDTEFYDTWSIQFSSGNGYTEISLSGDLHADVSQWNTNQLNVLEMVDYKITMPNLAEHYHGGTILYLDVAVYEPYTSNRVVLKNMDYRISLLDGNNTFTMVDWSPISYTTDINSFPLNTNWFHIGYTYIIEFRYSSNGAVVYIGEDKFKFKIIE